MNAGAVTIYRSNTDCVIGVAEGLALAVWIHHTKPEDVDALGAAAVHARRISAGPIGLVQIVPGSAIAPDGRARAELARMLRQLSGTASHSAIVHEAEGFRAAMIRSIVTSIAALSNPGFPHRVFARVPEATRWMGRGGLNAQKLEADIAAIRARIAPGKGADPRALDRRQHPAVEHR